MTISLRSGGWLSLAARLSVLTFAGALATGCASDKASSSSGGTTPVSNAKSSGTTEGGSIEEEAIVKVKENFFPPVDVGPWVCEPKSWDESRMARLRCTAPAGTKGLVASLKSMEEIESAEPAK